MASIVSAAPDRPRRDRLLYTMITTGSASPSLGREGQPHGGKQRPIRGMKGSALMRRAQHRGFSHPCFTSCCEPLPSLSQGRWVGDAVSPAFWQSVTGKTMPRAGCSCWTWPRASPSQVSSRYLRLVAAGNSRDDTAASADSAQGLHASATPEKARTRGRTRRCDQGTNDFMLHPTHLSCCPTELLQYDLEVQPP